MLSREEGRKGKNEWMIQLRGWIRKREGIRTRDFVLWGLRTGNWGLRTEGRKEGRQKAAKVRETKVGIYAAKSPIQRLFLYLLSVVNLLLKLSDACVVFVCYCCILFRRFGMRWERETTIPNAGNRHTQPSANSVLSAVVRTFDPSSSLLLANILATLDTYSRRVCRKEIPMSMRPKKYCKRIKMKRKEHFYWRKTEEKADHTPISNIRIDKYSDQLDCSTAFPFPIEIR